MPKSKKAKPEKKVRFFTEGERLKDPTIDPLAPTIGGEFVQEREDGEWRGQTITAHSDTKLESDTGYGEEVIMRAYRFGANPEAFKSHPPTIQQLFDSHAQGIRSMLWTDGLRVAEDIPPRIVFSEQKDTYMIIVGARASIGQFFMEKPQTLTEILKPNRNDTRRNPNHVSGSL